MKSFILELDLGSSQSDTNLLQPTIYSSILGQFNRRIAHSIALNELILMVYPSIEWF